MRVLFCLALLATTCALTAQSLTHGSMIGAVDHQSAIVWARAATTADVRVVTNSIPTLTSARISAPASADASNDFNVKIAVTGLSPASTVWYLVRIAAPNQPGNFVDGPWSRFRTAPAPNDDAPVRFVVGGDVRSPSTHSHSLWTTMQATDPDFFLSLGDFPYADIGGAAVTRQEYRNKHLDARSDLRCQAFHRQVPIFPIWDDHEVLNNWDANTPAARVTAGIQAFHDMLPTPFGRDDIYRSIRYGRHLEVFLTDCRRYRGVNDDPDLPNKTMLGAAQEAWLFSALSSSTATFKVIAVSVPINYNGGRDSWPGYRQAKRRLLDGITARGIENVVFVSADTHRTSFHHLHEGFREYMLSPVANGTGSAFAFQDLGRRFDYDAISNFGLLTIDPSVSPPRLRVEVRNEFATVGFEEIAATEVTPLCLRQDHPEGRADLTGTRYNRIGGKDSRLERMESGPLRIDWRPLPGLDAMPAPLEFTVPNAPDAAIAVAAQWQDERDQRTPVLYSNGFDDQSHGLFITDLATSEGPSAWFNDEGYLWQSSNINGSVVGVHAPGTLATTGALPWRDQTIRVRARSIDNDAFGVVFRYVDPSNHYAFLWDSERGRRWLIRRLQGQSTLLASDTVSYTTWRWYDLEVQALGSQLSVKIDGEVVLSATDAAIPVGGAGLSTWANSMTSFDDFVVYGGDPNASATPPLFASNFTSGGLAPGQVVDETSEGGPSAWAVTSGELRQTSNIGTGGDSLSQRGTTFLYGDQTWTDLSLAARLFNGDDDTFGVVLRDDGVRSWRFLMNSQVGWRRLVRVQNGVMTILAEQLIGYEPSRWYEFAAETRGSRVQVWLDGMLFASLEDLQGPAQGRAGFASAYSTGVRIDQLRIRNAPRYRASLAAIQVPGRHDIIGRAEVQSSGATHYQLALAFDKSPGLPLNSVGLMDPRVLPLNFDDLFLFSFDPLAAPFFSDFGGALDADGRFAAALNWPPVVPAGFAVELSGWTYQAQQPGLPLELLPALKIVFP